MSGHDVFPAAATRVFPEQQSSPFPGLVVSADEMHVVLSQSAPEVEADLIIIVSRAIDHHGNDVRGLVAERIAKGLAQ